VGTEVQNRKFSLSLWEQRYRTGSFPCPCGSRDTEPEVFSVPVGAEVQNRKFFLSLWEQKYRTGSFPCPCESRDTEPEVFLVPVGAEVQLLLVSASTLDERIESRYK
jgi:hypothetical protein